MSRDEELDRAFEEIVSHVDFDEPEAFDLDQPDTPASERSPKPPDSASDTGRLADVFGRTAWSDPLETGATWEDEGHFVPPDPGPAPPMEPGRRVAWVALLGSPALMVVVALLRLGMPPWVFGALGLAFVVAFVYLVATMSRHDDDPWSGDDGAVL